MKEAKRISLIILTIILSIFIILFIIQFIDQAINGETYKKIDTYFKEINKVNKTEDARICKEDGLTLLNGTLIAEIKGDKDLVDKTLKNKDRFTKTIDACNSNINSLSKIEIPNIKVSRKNTLIECRKHLISYYKDEIDALILLRTCNEKCSKEINKKCNKLMNKSGYEAILFLNYHIKSKDRLTVKSIVSKPWAIYIEKQLSKAQKYIQINEGL